MSKKHLGPLTSKTKKRGGTLQKREPSSQSIKKSKDSPDFLKRSSFEGNTDLNVTDAEWGGGEFLKY